MQNMAQAVTPGMKNLSLTDPYVLVAAIDFGTTFSGYAFSFVSNPDKILMNKNWAEMSAYASYKVPTSVLTKPDGSFYKFGFEAEMTYNELDPDKDPVGGCDGYNLYRHFKMVLHDKVSRIIG